MLRPWSFHIELNTGNTHVPMYKQVAGKIRELIQTGILRPGDALPGSRELATQLGVSRKTIVNAMETLVFGGLLINKERVGLFVAGKNESPTSDRQSSSAHNSDKLNSQPVANIHLRVNDGFPDTKILPFAEFSRAYRQFFNRAAKWQSLGYNDAKGYEKFRNAIAQMVSQERGLSARAEEVCVTRGSQMALYLVANAVLRRGDAVAIESPGYGSVYEIFAASGLEVIPVKVDKEGLKVSALARIVADKNIKAVYVTPRHQYPTTVQMSPARRRELTALAEEHNMLVIEDDFGSEFQFHGQRIMPLSCMMQKSNYIYIGTFSKVFAPAIRVGYMISSTNIINKVGNYRHIIDIQGDTVAEQAMLTLIENGDIKRHIRKASKIYKEKLDNISKLINTELKGLVAYAKPHGGLAVCIRPTILYSGNAKDMKDELQSRLNAHGISAPAYLGHEEEVYLRIGYASMSEDETTELIRALKNVLNAMMLSSRDE